MQGGFTFKFDKYFTDLQCFTFQFGGVGALFGGLSPPKPPVATGLNQGRNDGEQGAQLPERRMIAGRRKVLAMSQELQCSTFASERPQVQTQGR